MTRDNKIVFCRFSWKPFGRPMDSKKDANLDLLSQYFTKKSSFEAHFVDLA